MLQYFTLPALLSEPDATDLFLADDNSDWALRSISVRQMVFQKDHAGARGEYLSISKAKPNTGKQLMTAAEMILT
ncbi:hypothetical protein PBY51_013754 [Eleginops maclovinus]|uniref:Uncharacterized protein n=1 Tax=Eleginops maclovinus TaxID=56733 RepID=A0AAN7Y7A5_ELEMC|nr:hypothetical protein PBY51_013754 [Eleginops maclovinus]